MKKYLFVALVPFLPWSIAQADWADPGLAYQCARAKHQFSVASVMNTSSPEDPGTVKAPPGFVLLPDSKLVQCNLGASQVHAIFRVRAPQATGMCAGITQISIESLTVGGKSLFDAPELFNHYCIDEEALHSIEVRVSKGTTHINVCYAQWNWGIGYHNKRCEVRNAPLHE